jgi:hypothetical protein
VSERNASGDLRTKGHRREKRLRVCVEHVSSPVEAPPRERNALRIAQTPKRDQVVIPSDTDSVQRLDRGDAFVREWSVTDEIARDQVAVDAQASEMGQSRLEGRQVSVDVGEDAVPHALTTSEGQPVRRAAAAA